jgi:hypothetical protein
VCFRRWDRLSNVDQWIELILIGRIRVGYLNATCPLVIHPLLPQQALVPVSIHSNLKDLFSQFCDIAPKSLEPLFDALDGAWLQGAAARVKVDTSRCKERLCEVGDNPFVPRALLVAVSQDLPLGRGNHQPAFAAPIVPQRSALAVCSLGRRILGQERLIDALDGADGL